ncbi:TetR/AcrR family transcriptional regulator [Leptospira bandrabouensis]|uniref:TetR/AcrR family transcriptional regulator n=1 Tax=Leptospira bandrabouensis TaxID=2484903 RepID=UPI002448AF52|nr:TetR/AcrR family transcriptional regulator [Leptospira bandrabouensis]MCG6145945.1 TetR/AcrR family transcriptional regulator [Leptospira bandrabouensis]MCG6165532.1 TetR/AcrR family transcriptional regulator [Leptospira bandrabouensis]
MPSDKQKPASKKKIKSKPNVSRVSFTREKDFLVKTSVIDVARKMVLEHGYPALSIRTLMAALEYSPMVFYRYFPNKRALLHHLWDDIYKELLASCKVELDLQKPMKGSRIQKIALKTVDFWLKYPDKYKIVYLNPDTVEDSQDKFFVDSLSVQSYLKQLLAAIDWERKTVRFRNDMSDEDILRSMAIAVQGITHSLITVSEFPWGSHKRLCILIVDIWYKGILESQ